MASVYNVSRTSYDEPELPPGSPPTIKYEGPWLSTQITISSFIGMASLLIFSYCRTRWPLLFAPRTQLKGFSPHEAHAHGAFLGWILPTLRTSEYSVLQIVGLDAAVLLNFFKMSFYLFSLCSAFAVTILMPVNLKNNIGIGDEDDDDPDWRTPQLQDKSPHKRPDWFDLVSDANSYLSLHLVFTYLFTLLSLRLIFLNYKRFIKTRQLFSLQLVHSIAARTVMATGLPPHLRSERVLAEHFENMKLSVESVSICREISSLERLIEARTRALLKLEEAWVRYVGNPSTVETYDPSDRAIIGDGDPASTEAQAPNRFVVPHHRRPTIRPGWFSGRVDAIEFLEKRFLEADEAVKRHRRTGRFKPMDVGFITFEKMSSAQIAAQTVHTSTPFQLETRLAPEPRDIVWTNVGHSTGALRFREAIALGFLALLFFFWFIPITGLASLLSYKEIKKAMPWLGRLIDSNEKIRAIVQNSLPSVAMITLNALLPFLLEGITYVQGIHARSLIEYSLMKKYFLFLLVNVVFIFLLASTYWQLVRDLANSPAKIPEKLAQALQMGRARHFFLSYVILQGLGIMPLHLLNLGIIIPRVLFRLLITRTPRDFAELNAPPVINYGTVYPQAILIFVITLLYSIAQPLILIFGAVYFGVAYLVYKYKLLFVFYKPYESQGQAWPITFTRLIWGVVIFLVFMSGNFVLKGYFVLSSLVAPLVVFTVTWSVYISRSFRGLNRYVNLSAVFEVQRGEETEDVSRLRAGHPVTWSQSNLNRRRYAQNDDVLYVAPEDDHTDYSQPPMANWYNGVLNTGKKRYGHPALTGLLPQPWLPLKRGETLVNSQNTDRTARNSGQAVVLSLRKRYSVVRRGGRSSTTGTSRARGVPIQDSVRDSIASSGELVGDVTNNPWQESTPDPSNLSQLHHTINHRLSYDFGSGVIILPDDGIWLEGTDSDSEDDDGDGEIAGGQATPERVVAEDDDQGSGGPDGQTVSGVSRTRYGTYFHHPERRWQSVPGAFPTSS
ncbi:DUF221-domain-containing protein [Russula ochroleuca]|uniref:DUF221-domain-containing protein n=1 Tax=Russula ochroleuca TaxID=152965 RepID=A0A9P5N0L5_9AGAM|nr:DUF221-domain-containing protein [Russula ochroleuca]